MRQLNLGPKPDYLDGNEEAWGLEFEAAIAQGRKPPARYRDDSVRDGARDETFRKCAYCEGYIEHISYSHIEHILPKSRFPRLACTWSNLTLACQICNTNKGNHFQEDCPILNPYTDSVEESIVFYGPMAMHRDDRGRLSIARIRINRTELLFSRTEKLKAIEKILELMDRAADNAAVVQALEIDLDDALAPHAEYSRCASFFADAEREHRGVSP